MVAVNMHAASPIAVPLEGMKGSGIGRGGAFIDDYAEDFVGHGPLLTILKMMQADQPYRKGGLSA